MDICSDNNYYKTCIFKFYLALFLRALLLLSPVILFFYQENGLSYRELFLFQGFFYIACLLSEFPVGFLCNMFSRRNIILFSFVMYMLMIILWICCHGFWIILIGEIIFAISKVMMDNATSCYLYDFLAINNKQSNMTKIYGNLNFFLALSTAIAGILGSIIYTKINSAFLLKTELIFMAIAVWLIISLPNIKHNKAVKSKINYFLISVKYIWNKKYIRYYIMYSGLLTSFSVLFAVSFQPIMQKSLFPIYAFGILTFINHSIRAMAGILSGKVAKLIEINKIIKPLYFLYLFAIVATLIITVIDKKFIIFSLLSVICIIIGMQLIFTIMHISRLHKYVDISKRGSVISINNFVSKGLTASILIISRIFLDNTNLFGLYIVALILFIIFSTYIMSQACKVEV